MELSDVFLGLGQDSFVQLIRGISIGKLKTYQLYDRVKTRMHLAKLNAETLQRTVLPGSLPRIDGIHLAARYLPGTAELDVGGDWFDAIRLGDVQLYVNRGIGMEGGMAPKVRFLARPEVTVIELVGSGAASRAEGAQTKTASGEGGLTPYDSVKGGSLTEEPHANESNPMHLTADCQEGLRQNRR